MSSLLSRYLEPSRKRKAEDDPPKPPVPPKRKCVVYDEYYLQNWSIPTTIIDYIIKNPSSAKCYLKLAQSCKYFFIKHPVIVIDSIYLNMDYKWMAYLNNDRKRIDFKRYSIKFWISDKLFKSNFATVHEDLETVAPEFVPSIIPKLFRSDIKELYYFNEKLSYSEYSFLASKAEDITLRCVKVRNKNGSIAPLERLIEATPKLTHFSIDNAIITENTVTALTELPHFSKIKEMKLDKIDDSFDIETFFTYAKTNKYTKFYLFFDRSISAAYKKRLQEIIDEIVSTENHDYKVPAIYFDGVDENFSKLIALYYQ